MIMMMMMTTCAGTEEDELSRHLGPLGSEKKSTPTWRKSTRDYLAGLIKLPRGITVDSGAADSVFPCSWVRKALMRASAGSLAGLFYVAASGQKLNNLGEFLFKFVTPDGSEASIMFQLADINKPLASVAHLTDLGYCVVFNRHNGRDVSYLLHKATNQYLKMRRERGVFVIDAYLHELIAPRTEAEKIPSDFIRRG